MKWPLSRKPAREPQVYVGDPRFEKLPALLEGGEGQGATAEQVAIARDLRKKGLAARKRRKGKAA